jgi:hypothetical protein
MTMLEYVERWAATGGVTPAQADEIAALVRKDRFSVFVELNTLLYLGVVALVGGIGWTIQSYLVRLGDAVILSALTLIFAATLYYCFSRAVPYSTGQVDQPGFAFDYVLYLGCLVFAVELAYVESQLHLLRDNWNHYLLLSSVVFFLLAYRFDNRFVLSLALSTLAGWFGIQLFDSSMLGHSLRNAELVYGIFVAMTGGVLYQAGIKKHFLEAYLHVAGNVLFIALLSAVVDRDGHWIFILGLVGLSALAVALGLRFKRFAFVLYGIVYGYIGLSARVIYAIDTFTGAMAYVAVSGTIVIVALVVLARRFGRDE